MRAGGARERPALPAQGSGRRRRKESRDQAAFAGGIKGSREQGSGNGGVEEFAVGGDDLGAIPGTTTMPPPLVYHPDYFSDIGVHVFPTEKYARILEELRTRVPDIDRHLHLTKPASHEQLLRVHSAAYLADLDACRASQRTMFAELPLSPQIVGAYYLMTGGTCLAASLADRHGCAMNLGGGFHHAFADRAEGFCYINDIAVAVRDIQERASAERVAVIDCDLHQGNGTARIFVGKPAVYTFSIHQERLYPVKEISDLDIGLDEGTGNEEYLEKLEGALEHIRGVFAPEFVIYVAGVDPSEHDLLGALKLTKAGLRRRDEMVLGWCRERGTPVVVVLAGGYAQQVADTVEMHVNTYLAMAEVFGGK